MHISSSCAQMLNFTFQLYSICLSRGFAVFWYIRRWHYVRSDFKNTGSCHDLYGGRRVYCPSRIGNCICERHTGYYYIETRRTARDADSFGDTCPHPSSSMENTAADRRTHSGWRLGAHLRRRGLEQYGSLPRNALVFPYSEWGKYCRIRR